MEPQNPDPINNKLRTSSSPRGYRVYPKTKQKKVFALVMKGKTVSEAMKISGYSKSSSKRPAVVTETKGWKQLMEQYIPDDLLASKHKALLAKLDKNTGDIDSNSVAKGLDMAYKLKGHYAAEKKEFSGNISLSSLFDRAKDDNL